MAKPLELALEFARKERASDPFEFRFGPQAYLRRLGHGRYKEVVFAWSQDLWMDLENLGSTRPDLNAVYRLGTALHDFLESAGWGSERTQIQRALEEGREVHLCLRSAAAELYALPWELMSSQEGARSFGLHERFTLRYEWPRELISPHASAVSAAEGRLLLAWAGDVPAAAHVRALAQACQEGDLPFDPERDVLGHVSVRALSEELERSERQTTALHILCHGGREGRVHGLRWNASDPLEDVELVDGGRLRDVLAPYAGQLRLVVLCACYSGDAGEPGNHLGSLAQELHRAGIPAVVASRLPLSVKGSLVLAEELYRELLVRPASLQRALAAARRRLRERLATQDWASLQLYCREEAGTDFRPLALRPYRGLLAFEEKHRRFFFGRRELEEELLTRVRESWEGRKPRFQVVAGASGSGKSSLVLAGLVPRLREEGEWDVQVMQPSEAGRGRPRAETEGPCRFATLARLRVLLHGAQGAEPLPAGEGATEEELLEEVRRTARPGRKLLLVVDQFEEIFTQVPSPEERDAFVRTLWRLASERELGVLVLATLRMDAFERCGEVRLDENTWLEDVVCSDEHRLFVVQIRADRLVEIIEEPARRVGLEFDAGLVEVLKKDVEQEPGALPLLEHALDLVWRQREGHRLTQAAYAGIGSVVGAIKSTGDQLYGSLPPAEQHQARRLLVKLVALGDEASPHTRRRVWLEKVRPQEEGARAAFDSVVAKFVSNRLLVTGRELEAGNSPGGAWIQIAHEALIRKWDLLGQWVREDGEQERQLREVESLAEAWAAHRNDLDGGEPYLLRGTRLGNARSIVEKEAEALSALGREFLERSREAERRRQQEEELRRVAEAQREEALRQRTAALDAMRLTHANQLRDLEPALAMLVLREVAVPGEQWEQAAHAVLRKRLISAVLDHGGELVFTAFSPDGQRVVTTSKDGTARVWRADGRGDPIVLASHGGPVLSAAFSPDGQQVMTASEDGTVRVWRVDGKGEPRVFGTAGGRVRAAAFSPDGQLVVMAGVGNTARAWRLDGMMIWAMDFEERGGRVLCATFSPDGWRVVTASEDGTVRVWRVGRQDPPLVLAGHEGPVLCAAFSPDGQRVVTASEDKTARVWRTDEKGEPLVLGGRSFSGHQGAVLCAAFSPDGQQVVTASVDKTVRVWRLDVKNVNELDMFSSRLSRHESPVSCAAFSPDGQRVVGATVDGRALVWRLGESDQLSTLASHGGPMWSAAFSPDGQRVVAASEDKTARVWRADGTGSPLVVARHQGAVLCAAFSPDGQRVVTASEDKTASVWRADVEGVPIVLAGHQGAVQSAAFSPDGQRVVTASEDGTARVWRADGAGTPIVLARHRGAVLCAAFSPDGQRVVMALADKTAQVWRVDGEGSPVVLAGHEDAVWSAAFSPEGQRVVTASVDGTVRVWRADGQGPCVILVREQEPMWSAAFSADGQWVVMASARRTAQVCRADGTGTPRVVATHQGAVLAAALSVDGEWVVTASKDGTARVSAVGNKALRELLWRANTASLTPEQRMHFLMEASEQARAGYEQCERMYGRSPLDAPRPLRERTS